MTSKRTSLKELALTLRAYIIQDRYFLLVLGASTLGAILVSWLVDDSGLAYLAGFWAGISIGTRVK